MSPRLIAELHRTWQATRARHTDVPEVVIVLGSGSEGRQDASSSASSAGRCQRSDGELAESIIGGEGLGRGAREFPSVLLHEETHGVARTRGIADTSRQGR